MLSYAPSAGSFARSGLARPLTSGGDGAALRAFQIQGHSFSVDQDDAAIDQLLARAIILGVATEGGERHHEFHGFTAGFRRLVDGGAEVDAVELGVFPKVFGDRPEQVR